MSQVKKKLLLLVNLGSPNSLDVKAIKSFLAKFLSDRKVVRLPKILWYPILYGIILPFRSKKLLIKYAIIWNNGSPLVNYTKNQADNLSQYLLSNNKQDDDIIVKYAFSYSEPLLSNVLNELSFEEQREIVVIPLYPQFSSTTTLPILNQLTNYFDQKNKMFTFKLIQGFHNHPLYISLLVKKISQFWQTQPKSQHLIFSYHSLPLSVIKSGDSYYQECLTTTALIVKALNLNASDYSITFQSRFGAEKWLSPVTSDSLIALAQKGVKSVDIICPGFISDCLETLEEIAVQNKEFFLSHGGNSYNYIPCLNDNQELNQLFLDLSK
jgi:ferrochelatase